MAPLSASSHSPRDPALTQHHRSAFLDPPPAVSFPPFLVLAFLPRLPFSSWSLDTAPLLLWGSASCLPFLPHVFPTCFLTLLFAPAYSLLHPPVPFSCTYVPRLSSSDIYKASPHRLISSRELLSPISAFILGLSGSPCHFSPRFLYTITQK